MTGFFVYKMLLRDLARPARLITWGAIALFVGLMGWGYMAMSQGPDKDFYPTLSSVLVFRVLALTAAIFSSSVVAQEVEQKTIVYLLTRPIPRATLIAMRILSAVTMVIAITFFTAVIVSFVVNKGGFLANEYLWRDLPAIIVGAMAYCTCFVFISLIANKSMIINLLYAFAWETSIPNMPGTMYVLSISSYLQTISERPSLAAGKVLNFLAGSFSANTMPVWQAWTVILMLIGVSGALCMWWFSRFEFTPREDAE